MIPPRSAGSARVVAGSGATVARVYQALLTRRYLTSKIMPLLAAVAVMLCTGMVIVVWSVMGGFLNHLVNSGRVLIGDVVIEWPNAGFPYYGDLVKRLEAHPMIEAAAPAIVTYSLIVLPDNRKEMVLIRGIEGESFARVTGYESSLWWRPIDEPLRKDAKREDPRLDAGIKGILTEVLENGRSLTVPGPVGGERLPAVVPGIEVSGFAARRSEGFFEPRPRLVQRGSSGGEEVLSIFLPRQGTVTLNLVPVDSQGRILDIASVTLRVANEFHTGLYEMDKKTALVELGELQRRLKMDRATRIVPPERPGGVVERPDGTESFSEGFEGIGVEPARVTTVYVRGRGEANAEAVASAVGEVYREFAAAHRGEVPPPGTIDIRTWRDQNRTMIAAVEKETGLVLILFSFISVTAVFLVLAIFWSMVAEKTKDIGVLRALGASRTGVAWVWVRYGLVIGVIGGLAGGAMSYAIVTNINDIHEWLGEAFGLYIWDPRIYYFSEIPARFKWLDASVVAASGVVSSAVGALVPAVRASRMDPVRALRFE
ncbi:MAG: ABC transporter permease [Phycisphaeraceae bacterium]|nr:MAG: ABC transporter permease [Phycisphaeraceae bacterium]